MIRVGVSRLVVAVDHHDLWPGPPDDRHQALDGLLERRLGEAQGILIGRRSGHPRVAIAQHDDLVVADDLGGPGELLLTQLGDPGVDLGCVHGRVEDLPLLPPVQQTSTVWTPSAW